MLTIVSGGNQSAVPGYYTSAPLVVEVRDSAGNLLRNAPVTLSVAPGTGHLSLSRDANSVGSAMLIARTDANGQVTAYYMPNAGGPTQITIAPTGGAPGSSITAEGKPLDPAGDEDEDGKTNQEESDLGTDLLIFNLFSEHHYDGHAETPHTASDPLPWTFYTESLTGAPPAWGDLDLTAQVVFDGVGTANNWVVDDYASINDNLFVRLGYDLIYDVSAWWNNTSSNTFTATSDIRGGVFCAAYKVILSVELPVEIKLDTNQANLGGFVPSNLGANGYDHFVSPPNLADNPNYDSAGDYVTFVASGVTAEQFSRLLKWDGAFGEDVLGAPNKRRVKRDVARNNILRVLTKDGDREVSRLNVWIVKADISPDPAKTALQPFLSPNFSGATLRAENYFVHAIQPLQIFNDLDRPALDEEIHDAPGSSPCKNLNNGVQRRWDASRQVSTSYVKTNFGLTLESCADEKGITFPQGSDANIVGNDDGESDDERKFDPYLASALGYVTDEDAPQRVVDNFQGMAGDSVQFNLLFREFTRVKIGNTWYRISPFYRWHVTFAFKKIGASGTSGTWTRDDSSTMVNDGY